MGWDVRNDLFVTVSSASTNSIAYNVEGMWYATLQTVGSPSTTTLQVSNDDGRTTAITNWTSLATFSGNSAGVLPLGYRWMRCIRSETTNAVLSGWQRSR